VGASRIDLRKKLGQRIVGPHVQEELDHQHHFEERNPERDRICKLLARQHAYRSPMNEAQLIAIVKSLVQMQAENLAMRKILVRTGQTGS
jgi:hypothetical protein